MTRLSSDLGVCEEEVLTIVNDIAIGFLWKPDLSSYVSSELHLGKFQCSGILEVRRILWEPVEGYCWFQVSHC